MKQLVKIILGLGLVISASSCFDKNSPNYQYMPNMYESVGYETYEGVDNGLFKDGTEALTPPENTVNREWLPYQFDNTLEGKELARLQASPLDSLQYEDNMVKGAELYAIYCAICHGVKGDGQGTLVKREKILGVPSYADAARNITVGSTYHTMYYGLNSMGSYASQMSSEKELWQVAEYVIKLKGDLSK
ncbi:c-type cytochrome [Croceivirga sp. JEA036]|uniref:c-type cytochrome n=1 Tax=Croceivirga sp. JEA036 TaxID=2721162 RepID=UPI00143CB571|nr:cytochrome c [Croceivirga sp. JEA036]NJB36241.1 cytochrome c [Croceivirga sp. JEA036]